jgi:putative transferase (TIGR04331 family)
MVIVEGYFGYKNSIRIFLRSFGKILIIPRCLLFNYGIKDSIINYDIRNKIKVNEKDLFDRIFNNLLINFIPKSFLENYDDIKNKFLFYINNIPKLGSATLHYINDDFNIFLAEFKKKKKNFYIFQHGAYYGLLKYDLREVRDRQVAFKTYYWNNKKGLGFNYLTRFKKISSKYLVNNNKIIYFAAPIRKYGITSILMANADYSADQDGSTAIKIFNNLNNKLKPEYLYRAIKISLYVNSLYKYTNKVIKNIRKHKINLDRNLSSKISFNEAKIIILDNFSTAFYECIYIGIPVIVITDINKFNFKEDIKNIFIRLKDKGLIYDNPESAAIFLNKNYDNLINWWNNLFYSKLMKELKVFLFHEDKDFCRKIVFELKK